MKTGIYLAARILGLSRYRYILMHTVIATHGQARVHTHTRAHTHTHTHSRYRYILMHTVIATHGQVCTHTHTRTHTQTSKRAMGPCMLGFKLFGPTLGPS